MRRSQVPTCCTPQSPAASSIAVARHNGWASHCWATACAPPAGSMRIGRPLGIHYQVQLDNDADLADLERLITAVDDVAEIPRAVRAGARVTRVT